jgi:hypothetical protein
VRTFGQNKGNNGANNSPNCREKQHWNPRISHFWLNFVKLPIILTFAQNQSKQMDRTERYAKEKIVFSYGSVFDTAPPVNVVT